MNTRKCIKKQVSKTGYVFAILTDGTTYEVWKLCKNYDGQCKNGERKTWRYVAKDLDSKAAEKLFYKRIS